MRAVGPAEIRYQQLDGLRGLAAAAVFLFHAILMLPKDSKALHFLNAPLLRPFWDGPSAVMLFFVLSGFVLALPYIDVRPRKIAFLPFWIKRITRLYPAYWVALILALAIRFLVFQPHGLAALSPWVNSHWTLSIDWLSLVKHASMISPYLDANQIDPVIWSLVIEMKISLTFPILLLLLRKTPTAIHAVVATFSAFAVTALLYSFVGEGSSWVRAAIMAPVFLMGAYLAKYRVAIVSWLRLSIQSRLLFAMAGILLYDLTWICPTLNRGVLRFSTACGSSIFIILFLASRRLEHLGKTKAIQFVGRVSYSFYLVHLPILLGVASILYPIMRSLPLVFGVSLVCSLLTAWLTLVLVETPAQAWGKRIAELAGKLKSAKPTATFAG